MRRYVHGTGGTHKTPARPSQNATPPRNDMGRQPQRARTPNAKQRTQRSSTARQRHRRPSAGDRLHIGPQRQLLRDLLEARRLGVELGRLDELQEEVGEALAQP